MKQMLAITLILSISLCVCFSIPFVMAETKLGTVESIEQEQTVLPQVTVNDSYVLGEVLVVLKKSASEINHRYSVYDFTDIGVETVMDLTYITNAEAITWLDGRQAASPGL